MMFEVRTGLESSVHNICGDTRCGDTPSPMPVYTCVHLGRHTPSRHTSSAEQLLCARPRFRHWVAQVKGNRGLCSSHSRACRQVASRQNLKEKISGRDHHGRPPGISLPSTWWAHGRSSLPGPVVGRALWQDSPMATL